MTSMVIAFSARTPAATVNRAILKPSKPPRNHSISIHHLSYKRPLKKRSFVLSTSHLSADVFPLPILYRRGNYKLKERKTMIRMIKSPIANPIIWKQKYLL